MKNKNFVFYGFIIAFVMLFLASAVIFRVYNIEILPSQFYGALIGVFITAIVTAFLLRGQTEGDEKREKSVKVFEKKQEVYHCFLDKLKEIIQDGEIKVWKKDETGKIDTSVDDLKDIFFQLANIQMHINSYDRLNDLLDKLNNLIATMNEFAESDDSDKQKILGTIYSRIYQHITEITTILREDLYGDRKQTGSDMEDNMSKILDTLEINVTTKTLDKFGLQKYFWETLAKKLEEKGYEIMSNSADESRIRLYYESKRPRKGRWFGIKLAIKVNENLTVPFKIECWNTYYYGFPKKDSSDLIQNALPVNLKKDPKWYGRTEVEEKKRLDWWTMKGKGFEQLSDTKRRDSFMNSVVDEIDKCIKEFKQKAKNIGI